MRLAKLKAMTKLDSNARRMAKRPWIFLYPETAYGIKIDRRSLEISRVNDSRLPEESSICLEEPD
jgi:hypothetical protein